jgi:2-iminobutanoate/2-iminopropanoate deaminase
MPLREARRASRQESESGKRTVNPGTVADTLKYGFSQAVVVRGGLRVHLSGQVGVDADERTVGPDLESQTRAAIDNMAAILGEIGGALSHVVVLRIYIVESARGDQRFIGQVLRQRFPVEPPATSWIVVSGLSEPDWLIEIEAEAVLPQECGEPRAAQEPRR